MAKCPNSLYKAKTNTDVNMLPLPESLPGSSIRTHTVVLTYVIASSQVNIIRNKLAGPQQLAS